MRLEGHGGWAVEGVLACASAGHGKRGQLRHGTRGRAGETRLCRRAWWTIQDRWLSSGQRRMNGALHVEGTTQAS